VRYRSESEQSSSWLIPIGNAHSGSKRSRMRCVIGLHHHRPASRLLRSNCVKDLRTFLRRRSPRRPRRDFPIRQTFKSKCRITLLLARVNRKTHNRRDPHTCPYRRYRSHTRRRLPERRLSKRLRARPRASTTPPRTARPTRRVTGRRTTRQRVNRTITIESPVSPRGILRVDRERALCRYVANW